MLGLSPETLIVRLIILLISLPVHEFAHAWTADRFGDTTPRQYGRLTLNPLRHLDVMGSLMILFAGFGWAKPVPVNPYALGRKSPAALMWVSLAGPMSNFLMALLAVIPLRAGWVEPSAYSGLTLFTAYGFLLDFIYINLTLMLFNLIPLAPLDGDKIADYFFPPSWARALERIRPYGPMMILVLFIGLPYVGVDIYSMLITPVLYNLLSLLGVF